MKEATIWVLTREINEYNQDGVYFVMAWNHEPSKQELLLEGVPCNRLEHVLAGGGRVEDEYEWYHLEEEV